MTLLYPVKCFQTLVRGCGVLLQETKQLAGDDALEASFGFPDGLALAEAACDVGAGLGVEALVAERIRAEEGRAAAPIFCLTL
jgi:hypothetical protein